MSGGHKMTERDLRGSSKVPLSVLVASNMYPSDTDPRFGVFVSRFVRGLEQAGVRVRLAAITDSRTGAGRLAVKYCALLAKVVGAWIRGGYDAVHAHYLFPTGYFALLASAGRRKPLVLFSHGTDLLMARRGWPVSAMTAFAVSRAAVVVAPSEAHARALAETFGLSSDRVRVVPSGIDREMFSPNERQSANAGEHPTGPSILFAGALDDNKGAGCGDLLEAVALPGLEAAHLTVVGAGPLRDDLVARADRLGITDRVTFLAPLPSEKIAELLASADVLAVVPRERESLGLIALEARASHVPVVATRVGGLPEHVVAGVSGELVDPGDIGQLASALKLALERSSRGVYRYDGSPVADIESAGAELARLTRQLIEQGAR